MRAPSHFGESRPRLQTQELAIEVFERIAG
jgi:hypothetical protein